MTRNKTILYVEDDVVIQTAYRRRLEREGFTVATATDGIQAMRFLHQASPKPDLILLDLVLPLFDGEEVLKFITDQQDLCRIPVIILSTNSFISTGNESLVGQAEKHLLKNKCTFPILLENIEQALAGAAAPASAVPPNHHVCPAETPRAINLLKVNLRGAEPIVGPDQTHLPTA
jgi:CheY-like chemotaxis protein